MAKVATKSSTIIVARAPLFTSSGSFDIDRSSDVLKGEGTLEAWITGSNQWDFFGSDNDAKGNHSHHANPGGQIGESEDHALLVKVGRNQPVHIKPAHGQDIEGPKAQRSGVTLHRARHHPKEGD